MIGPVWETPELAALLAADIAVEPADPRWRREFAPELSYGRHAGPARSDARDAAVAVVLCWTGREWSLPLTVRSAGLSRHGGQVSLPGGLLDANEESRDAAQRELTEELACQPALRWLGEMTPLFVYASNALVTPCVAAVDGCPEWRPQPVEVDRVLTLRLGDLMDQPPTAPLEIQRGNVRFAAPQLLAEGHAVWGATAVILNELRRRIKRLTLAP